MDESRLFDSKIVTFLLPFIISLLAYFAGKGIDRLWARFKEGRLAFRERNNAYINKMIEVGRQRPIILLFAHSRVNMYRLASLLLIVTGYIIGTELRRLHGDPCDICWTWTELFLIVITSPIYISAYYLLNKSSVFAKIYETLLQEMVDSTPSDTKEN